MIHKNIKKLCGVCLLVYGLVFFIGIIFTNFVLAAKLENTNQTMPASASHSNKTNIQTPLFADNGKYLPKKQD
ncbi:MAG: hypothetical protein L3J53_05825 [Proteobacteria bacterium]|nr:hypothetical protein [Pseudomonadota bacterium]